MTAKNALARRAVACTAVALASGKPKWRCMPGMRLFRHGPSGHLMHLRIGDQEHTAEQLEIFARAWLPDLDDPATLGCIEHGLLPAAWDDYGIHLVPDDVDRRWCVFSPGLGRDIASGITKGEALVAALEAAP